MIQYIPVSRPRTKVEYIPVSRNKITVKVILTIDPEPVSSIATVLLTTDQEPK
jgi:hypothetical protein